MIKIAGLQASPHGPMSRTGLDNERRPGGIQTSPQMCSSKETKDCPHSPCCPKWDPQLASYSEHLFWMGEDLQKEGEKQEGGRWGDASRSRSLYLGQNPVPTTCSVSIHLPLCLMSYAAAFFPKGTSAAPHNSMLTPLSICTVVAQARPLGRIILWARIVVGGRYMFL